MDRRLTRIVAVVGGLLIMVLVIQSIRTRNVYAVVGGRAITKQQFDNAKKAAQSMANQTAGVAKPATDDKTVGDNLVLYAALLDQADKLKEPLPIRFDYDQQLPVVTLAGGKVVATREDYKKTFGWTDADVDSYAGVPLLEQKLAGKALHYLSYLQVATYFANVTGVPANQTETVAKQTLAQRAMPWFVAKNSANDILRSSDNNEHATVNSPSFIIGTRLFVPSTDGINQSQRTALSKLTKVGDYTPIMRSDAGYYYIARLEAKGEGAYESWQDFAKKSHAQAKIYGSGLNLRRFLLLSWR